MLLLLAKKMTTSTTRSSSILFVLILFVSETLAYECSIGFFFKTYVVAVETRDLCEYTIYHATMFLICAYVSVIFLFFSILSIILRCDFRRASCIASYAFAFLFMSMGFEFGWALMVLLFFMIIMLKVARDCELGCLAWCQSSAPRRRSVQVHPVFEVVIVPHHPLQTDSPSAPPLELLECARIFPVEECPICFEGVDVDKSWQSLRCGHTFHAACIETWPRRTCPVCRKPYG